MSDISLKSSMIFSLTGNFLQTFSIDVIVKELFTIQPYHSIISLKISLQITILGYVIFFSSLFFIQQMYQKTFAFRFSQFYLNLFLLELYIHLLYLFLNI